MKYRKKPVVIEAVQLTADHCWAYWLDRTPMPEPFNGLSISGDYHPGERTISRAYICIKTLEGVMRADLGDWIIRGVKGEFYPCKPDIFEQTYEAVT